MKFNRESLIQELQTKLSIAEWEHTEQQKIWDVALAQWKIDTNQEQVARLQSVADSLDHAIHNLLAQPDRMLTTKDLPRVSPDKYDTFNLGNLVPSLPTKIGDSYPPHDRVRLDFLASFVKFLSLSTDDEITDSAIIRMGFKDMLRQWL